MDVPEFDARRSLSYLVHQGLLDYDAGTKSYGLHDLLAELARSEPVGVVGSMLSLLGRDAVAPALSVRSNQAEI